MHQEIERDEVGNAIPYTIGELQRSSERLEAGQKIGYAIKAHM